MRNHTFQKLFGAGMAIAFSFLLPTCVNADNYSVDRMVLSSKQFAAKTHFQVNISDNLFSAPATRASYTDGPSADDVIIRNPEGEMEYYEKISKAYFGSFNAPNKFGSSDMTCVVSVIRNGDKIYMNNMWAQYMKNQGYIEGTVEGNIATFTFPQKVESTRHRDNGETYMTEEYCLMFDYVENAEHPDEEMYGNYLPCENQTLKFRIEDGELVPLEQGNRIMGWAEWEETSDGSGQYAWEWQHFGDRIESIKTITEQTVEVPSGLEFEEYAMYVTDNSTFRDPVNYAVPVKIAIDNKDVYISGLFEMLPDAFVKGTLADGKITIPSGQYMGYYPGGPASAYFVADTPVYYEYDGIKYLIDVAYNDNFVFDYDADNKKLTSQDLVYAISAEKAGILYFQSQLFDSPTLRQPNLTPVTEVPAPYNVVYNGLTKYSFPRLQFNYDNILDDDHVLAKGNLYLNLFVDGKQVKFTVDDYPEIKELGLDETYDIPMNFYVPSAATNFLFMLNLYYVMIYEDVKQSIGVRFTYKDGDNTICSPIAYADGYTDGIDKLKADDVDTNAPAVYYNLQGMRISKPAKGQIVIKVQGTNKTKQIF